MENPTPLRPEEIFLLVIAFGGMGLAIIFLMIAIIGGGRP